MAGIAETTFFISNAANWAKSLQMNIHKSLTSFHAEGHNYQAEDDPLHSHFSMLGSSLSIPLDYLKILIGGLVVTSVQMTVSYCRQFLLAFEFFHTHIHLEDHSSSMCAFVLQRNASMHKLITGEVFLLSALLGLGCDQFFWPHVEN